MAKCRNCGTDIPDGAEYCAECLSKSNTAKTSESYLDSLLSAVMTEEPERREIVFPKREASSLVSVPKDKKIEEINLRRKYKLSIVFIKRDKKVLSPEAELVLLAGDTLVVAGENSKIKAVANLINDASDIEEQLYSVFGEKQ